MECALKKRHEAGIDEPNDKEQQKGEGRIVFV